MSKANPAPALPEAPKTHTATYVKKQLDDVLASLPGLRERLGVIRQERELRKKSDPDLTDAVLADFDRREYDAEKAINRADERAAGLLVQYHNAGDREWEERARKSKPEVEKLAGPYADTLYKAAHDQILALGKTLTELRRVNAAVASLNKTAGSRVGFVEVPEHRIRHSNAVPGKSAH